jgi:hypothetical protein
LPAARRLFRVSADRLAVACFYYAVHGIDELLPWSWKNTKAAALAADLSGAFFCENVK